MSFKNGLLEPFKRGAMLTKCLEDDCMFYKEHDYMSSIKMCSVVGRSIGRGKDCLLGDHIKSLKIALSELECCFDEIKTNQKEEL